MKNSKLSIRKSSNPSKPKASHEIVSKKKDQRLFSYRSPNPEKYSRNRPYRHQHHRHRHHVDVFSSPAQSTTPDKLVQTTMNSDPIFSDRKSFKLITEMFNSQSVTNNLPEIQSGKLASSTEKIPLWSAINDLVAEGNNKFDIVNGFDNVINEIELETSPNPDNYSQNPPYRHHHDNALLSPADSKTPEQLIKATTNPDLIFSDDRPLDVMLQTNSADPVTTFVAHAQPEELTSNNGTATSPVIYDFVAEDIKFGFDNVVSEVTLETSPNLDTCSQNPPYSHDQQADVLFTPADSTTPEQLAEATMNSYPIFSDDKSLSVMLQTDSADSVTTFVPDAQPGDLTSSIGTIRPPSVIYDLVTEDNKFDIVNGFDNVIGEVTLETLTISDQDTLEILHFEEKSEQPEGHVEIVYSGAWNTTEPYAYSDTHYNLNETKTFLKKIRNRDHAKKSRDRRKAFVKSLRQENEELDEQNLKLLRDIQDLRVRYNVLSEWKQKVIRHSPTFMPREYTYLCRKRSFSDSSFGDDDRNVASKNIYTKALGELKKLSMKDDLLDDIIRHVGELDKCYEKSSSPWDVQSSARDTRNESAPKMIKTGVCSENPEGRVDLGGSKPNRIVSLLPFSKGDLVA